MNKSEVKKKFLDGLIDNNPVIVQLLGMCSTLAITTKLTNGIGMGISVTAVLVMSNIIISLFRKIVPNQIRIASYIVLIAGFVTALELLIRAYLPDLDESLGIYIPLIVVNCIILGRAEAFASKNKPLPSAVDGIAMGLGFTAAITVLAAVRELLGYGTLGGIHVFGSGFEGASIMAMPAGAFFTLGVLIAVVKYFKDKPKRATKVNSEVKTEE